MVDDQERLEVEVFQGESKRCSENARIGSFRFNLSPAAAGTPVRSDFAYDLNGVIRVSVSQAGGANQKTVALKASDAGKEAQQSVAEAGIPDSAIVRKAHRLLPKLASPAQDRMRALLQAIEQAPSAELRSRAEDDLLDLFVDLDSGSGEHDEGRESAR
jgi:molecular chaperone DnaK